MPAASDTTLQGRRILVTRAQAQFNDTARLIHRLGGIPIAFPCLEVQFLQKNIQEALKQSHQHSDVLWTSVNGVRAVQSVCKHDFPQYFQHQRIAAVGKRTAHALQQSGLHVSVIPQQASQEGLIKAYQDAGLPQSLLFFRAQQGSDALAQALQAENIPTQTVSAYQTICPEQPCHDIQQLLGAQQVDAVLLGSARTAEHYVQRVQDITLANHPVIAVMSQQVADAADKLGLNVQLIASQPNFPSMLDDLAHYFSPRSLS